MRFSIFPFSAPICLTFLTAPLSRHAFISLITILIPPPTPLFHHPLIVSLFFHYFLFNSAPSLINYICFVYILLYLLNFTSEDNIFKHLRISTMSLEHCPVQLISMRSLFFGTVIFFLNIQYYDFCYSFCKL